MAVKRRFEAGHQGAGHQPPIGGTHTQMPRITGTTSNKRAVYQKAALNLFKQRRLKNGRASD